MIMPLRLKNARAIYEQAMTAIFHNMVHNYIKDYADDLVIKSKTTRTHLRHLRQVFERCQKYDLKINPLKCAFKVIKGKFLGFIVDKGNIKIDEDKTKAILAMEQPQDLKSLRTFIGKVS